MDDAGDLAEAMVPVAAALIGAVHDEGAVAVARVLSVVAPENLPALCVVLAAMVDPDMSPGDLLAWVTFGEDANSVVSYSEQIAGRYGVDLSKIPADPRRWETALVRTCHAAAVHYRDVGWVLSGEREYQRRRMARKRGTQNANEVSGK
jgi:hypothetical protein